MKVKELVRKVADFGTDTYIYIQQGYSLLGGGKPDEVEKTFGEMTINTFIAANRGQIKIFVK